VIKKKKKKRKRKKQVIYQKLNQCIIFYFILFIFFTILGNSFTLICLSLSRLKVLDNSIIKTKILFKNLRSTMSQERLNGLTILSIEKEMLKKLKYKNLISNFASQKVKRMNFKLNNF